MNTKVKGRRYYYLLRSTGVRLRLWPNGFLVPLVCFCAEVSGAQLIAWSAHFESIYLYFLDRAKGTRTILAWVTRIYQLLRVGWVYRYLCYKFFILKKITQNYFIYFFKMRKMKLYLLHWGAKKTWKHCNYLGGQSTVFP